MPSSQLHNKSALFEPIVALTEQAGEAIMQYYQDEVAITRKDDASPVTEADHAAHRILVDGLRALTPDIPVISEESASHEIPEDATAFWLVDPLDGTKSFIRGKKDFAVCVGLIEAGQASLGVIHVPVDKATYFGAQGEGVWRKQHDEVQPIAAKRIDENGWHAVVSHMHLDASTKAFLDEYNVIAHAPVASAVKFCRVAEGAFDLYPRFGPTMEWDTAAGQALVEAAGAQMTTPEGGAFRYGKADLRNGAFIVKVAG